MNRAPRRKRRRRVFLSVRRRGLNRRVACLNRRNGCVSHCRRTVVFPWSPKERRHGRACRRGFRGRDFSVARRRGRRGFRIRSFEVNPDRSVYGFVVRAIVSSRVSDLTRSANTSGTYAGNRSGDIRRYQVRPSGAKFRHSRTVRPTNRMTRQRHPPYRVGKACCRSFERPFPHVRSFLKNRQSHGKTLIPLFRIIALKR